MLPHNYITYENLYLLFSQPEVVSLLNKPTSTLNTALQILYILVKSEISKY